MSYVDGFVIPVPKRKVAAYRKMAQLGKRMWMKAGALEYFECVGDDLKTMPMMGDFKKLAKLKPGETVFFSFIVFRNKEHRNAVNKKVMAGMSGPPPDMPFDTKRMAYGGFKTLVEAKA
jgi:alkaline phosphatase